MTPAGARLSVSCCFPSRKLRAEAPPACAYHGGRFLISHPRIVRLRPAASPPHPHSVCSASPVNLLATNLPKSNSPHAVPSARAQYGKAFREN